MINLLPPQQKKELEQEQRYRLVLILGILVLIFLICLTLILFSIKTYIWGEVEVQRIIVKQALREFEESKIKDFEKEVRETNSTFSKLESFYQGQIHLTGIFEKLSQTLPSGTYLTGLSYNLTPEKEYLARVSVSGFSPTREVLYQLKKNLEKEKKFKELDFPPSNWIKSTDIDFRFSFKIK